MAREYNYPARDRIVSTYVELARRNGSDISIKELVSKAGSNRSTFYSHFSKLSDIDEYLIERIVEDTVGKTNRFLREGLKDGAVTLDAWAPRVMDILEAYYAHQDDVMALDELGRGDELRSHLIDAMIDAFDGLRVVFRDQNGASIRLLPVSETYYLRSYAYTLLGYLETWSMRGFLETPEELHSIAWNHQTLSYADVSEV